MVCAAAGCRVCGGAGVCTDAVHCGEAIAPKHLLLWAAWPGRCCCFANSWLMELPSSCRRRVLLLLLPSVVSCILMLLLFLVLLISAVPGRAVSGHLEANMGDKVVNVPTSQSSTARSVWGQHLFFQAICMCLLTWCCRQPAVASATAKANMRPCNPPALCLGIVLAALAHFSDVVVMMGDPRWPGGRERDSTMYVLDVLLTCSTRCVCAFSRETPHRSCCLQKQGI